MYISLRIDPYTFYTTYANILIGNLPKVYVNRLSSPSLSKKKIPSSTHQIVYYTRLKSFAPY